MILTQAISYLTNQLNLKFLHILKISLLLEPVYIYIYIYTYTTPIPNKIFNYKVLKDLNIDGFKSKPPDCTLVQFIYARKGVT